MWLFLISQTRSRENMVEKKMEQNNQFRGFIESIVTLIKIVCVYERYCILYYVNIWEGT